MEIELEEQETAVILSIFPRPMLQCFPIHGTVSGHLSHGTLFWSQKSAGLFPIVGVELDFQIHTREIGPSRE